MNHDAYRGADPSIMLTKFPQGYLHALDVAAELEMGVVIEVIKKIRNIRAEMNIPLSTKFTVHISGNGVTQELLSRNSAQILKLARAEKLIIEDYLNVPKASARAVTANAEIAVPLEGLIDFEKEQARLGGQIEKLGKELDRISGQLSNEDFVNKAPAEKVDALRERKSELEQQIATLKTNLEALE